MNVSDTVLACARECASLSRQCGDEEMATALFRLSTRLLGAAAHEAELVADDSSIAASVSYTAFPAGV